jgi:hypothetical protein
LRVLLSAFLIGATIFFAPTILTKENLVVLVVGLLTLIGLLRVVTHEVHAAAREIEPAVTEIVEGYYKFRLRLLQLREEFQRARVADAPASLTEAPTAEYQRAKRSG